MVPPPRRGRVTHDGYYAKPSTKDEDGGLITGPRPGDGLRPIALAAVGVKLVV